MNAAAAAPGEDVVVIAAALAASPLFWVTGLCVLGYGITVWIARRG